MYRWVHLNYVPVHLNEKVWRTSATSVNSQSGDVMTLRRLTTLYVVSVDRDLSIKTNKGHK